MNKLYGASFEGVDYLDEIVDVWFIELYDSLWLWNNRFVS